MSDRPRILVTEKIAEGGIEVLRSVGDVDVELEWSADELAERIAPYDALVVRSATKVTAALIGVAPRLRVVGRAGTGVDNVDVEAATERGIVVVNAAGSNAVSAAEHAVALLDVPGDEPVTATVATALRRLDGHEEAAIDAGLDVDALEDRINNFLEAEQVCSVMLQDYLKALAVHTEQQASCNRLAA